MIAIPAIDVRGGACVQLVGGSFEHERIRLPDPLDAARRWSDTGFSRLHVVDLDAAAGVGANDDIINSIVSGRDRAVSVGGGVRTSERVAQLLAAGAESVVVGTRALEDPDWLDAIADRHRERIVVALDVRDRSVVIDAWTRRVETPLEELTSRLDALPLAGLLVTAVHREGLLAGPDVALVKDVVRMTRHPVIASGGITTLDDLRALEQRGAAACVIGMALYSGTLDASAVAAEFNT